MNGFDPFLYGETIEKQIYGYKAMKELIPLI